MYKILPGRSLRYEGETHGEGCEIDLKSLTGANIDSLIARGYVEAIVPIVPTLPPSPVETRTSQEPVTTPPPAVEPEVVGPDDEEEEESDESPETPDDSSVKVSINSASRDELMQLHSIGPKSARAIIKNRPYSTFDEVPDKADLRGSAAGDWDQNRALVVVDEV